MRSKEKILSEKSDIPIEDIRFKNEVEIIRPSECIEAMHEHAQEFAKAFAEWAYVNNWVMVSENRYHRNFGSMKLSKTTSELIQLFIEHLNHNQQQHKSE